MRDPTCANRTGIQLHYLTIFQTKRITVTNTSRTQAQQSETDFSVISYTIHIIILQSTRNLMKIVHAILQLTPELQFKTMSKKGMLRHVQKLVLIVSACLMSWYKVVSHVEQAYEREDLNGPLGKAWLNVSYPVTLMYCIVVTKYESNIGKEMDKQVFQSIMIQ